MSTLSQKIDAGIKLMDLLRADSTETQTPVNLVNEMLDKLPTKIWQDSTKTFLDPACGRGIFGLCILQRLFDGLQSVIPDEQERVNHILGKQIFLYDISPVMCMKAKTAFTHAIKAARLVNPGVHIYNKDSLEHPFNMKFDVIIGNPPYNSDSNAKKKLWTKFVLSAIRSGASNLMFVTPTSWAYGEKREVSEVRDALKGGLRWAELNASRFFPGVGEDISVWLWQKDFCGKTVVTTRRGETVEHNFETRFIEDDNKIFLSIEKKVMFSNEKLGLKCCNFEKNALSKIQSSHFQYSIQYSASQLLFSHDVPEHYFLPKVFINRSGHYWTAKTPEKYVRYMPQGVAGSLARYVVVNNEIEAENLVQVLHSKLFILLVQMNPTKNIQFKDDVHRLPKMDVHRSWTDDELYHHFGLTKEEITYIELIIEAGKKVKKVK